MPSRLIEQNHGVRTWCDSLRDLRQVQHHGVAVAPRQHEPGAGSTFWADRAEDIGRCGALIVRRRWSRTTLRPAARDLVLLADPGFVLKPDLYRLAWGIARRDLCHTVAEVFLKATTASGFCA